MRTTVTPGEPNLFMIRREFILFGGIHCLMGDERLLGLSSHFCGRVRYNGELWNELSPTLVWGKGLPEYANRFVVGNKRELTGPYSHRCNGVPTFAFV